MELRRSQVRGRSYLNQYVQLDSLSLSPDEQKHCCLLMQDWTTADIATAFQGKLGTHRLSWACIQFFWN